ncbi:MAG: twin-arginine translocation signal domain-containing protein, partial [Bacteroidota bacterium]
MNSNRRDFLKTSLLAGAALAFQPRDLFAKARTTTMSDMKLRFYPYTLELKHAFTVAVNTRTTTAVMMVEVEKDGIVGY